MNAFVSRKFDRSHSRGGWSLVEVMMVLTIIGILTSMSIPSFHRAVEQSRTNIAAANLRAIWAAERFFWLENRSFTSDLSALESLGILDPAVVSAKTIFVYDVPSADGSGFTAVAVRTGSSRWRGQLAIDDTGLITGVIQGAGETRITPGFQ